MFCLGKGLEERSTMEFNIKVNADVNQLRELFGYELTEAELARKVIEHIYSAGIQDYFEYNNAPLALSLGTTYLPTLQTEE